MIYLLRHGQTDWNKIHKLQGVENVPLNETGRQMARDAREKYKDIRFDCCYCSPLDRALETARIFLEGSNTPIIVDDRFIEMNFGIYEGSENIYSDEKHPLHDLFFSPEKYVPTDGVESFSEITKRTVDGIEDIRRKHDILKENILVTGHGAMCASIICHYNHIPIKDYWSALLKNCELYELKVEQ